MYLPLHVHLLCFHNPHNMFIFYMTNLTLAHEYHHITCLYILTVCYLNLQYGLFYVFFVQIELSKDIQETSSPSVCSYVSSLKQRMNFNYM